MKSRFRSEARQPVAVGRLAPSPTGALHLGNARTFLLAWLSIRQQSGRILLRIEDIDSPRVKSWAVEQTMQDLHWLGLDWDAPAAPQFSSYTTGRPNAAVEDRSNPQSSQEFWTQMARLPRYEQILQQLIEGERVYPCTCTRSDVAAAASAPHDEDWPLLEGQVYPGTCRNRNLSSFDFAQKHCWRWRFDDRSQSFLDRLHGLQTANPYRQLGDFVVAKSDGRQLTPAYQLAVVVDDYDQGITEVVRADDLLFSTYRQQAIFDFLRWQPPSYVHVPLVVGPDGRRLAKRHGDTRLSLLRQQGIAPQSIVGFLASTLGIIDAPRPSHPADLLGRLDWSSLRMMPTVFELQCGLETLHAMTARIHK